MQELSATPLSLRSVNAPVGNLLEGSSSLSTKKMLKSEWRSTWLRMLDVMLFIRILLNSSGDKEPWIAGGMQPSGPGGSFEMQRGHGPGVSIQVGGLLTNSQIGTPRSRSKGK